MKQGINLRIQEPGKKFRREKFFVDTDQVPISDEELLAMAADKCVELKIDENSKVSIEQWGFEKAIESYLFEHIFETITPATRGQFRDDINKLYLKYS